MSERISVVIPSLNMGIFLDAALRSIARQGVPVHEILLVDCGSTDETFDVVDRRRSDGLNIKVLECPRKAPASARNRGIAVAEGELIAFLDADDLWPAGKLERQLRRLVAQPKVEMVTGYVRYFEKTDESGLEPARDSRTESLFYVHVGACLYRKGVLSRIQGPFDEGLLYSEDVDLLLRLREEDVPFAILRSVELYYRRHAASMTAQDDPRRETGFQLATHKSLVRRRAAGTLSTPLRDFASYLEPEC